MGTALYPNWCSVSAKSAYSVPPFILIFRMDSYKVKRSLFIEIQSL